MNAKQQAKAAYRASVKQWARIKQENERYTKEQRNEHNTTAPGAQSIPNAAEHSNMHDSP